MSAAWPGVARRLTRRGRFCRHRSCRSRARFECCPIQRSPSWLWPLGRARGCRAPSPSRWWRSASWLWPPSPLDARCCSWWPRACSPPGSALARGTACGMRPREALPAASPPSSPIRSTCEAAPASSSASTGAATRPGLPPGRRRCSGPDRRASGWWWAADAPRCRASDASTCSAATSAPGFGSTGWRRTTAGRHRPERAMPCAGCSSAGWPRSPSASRPCSRASCSATIADSRPQSSTSSVPQAWPICWPCRARTWPSCWPWHRPCLPSWGCGPGSSRAWPCWPSSGCSPGGSPPCSGPRPWLQSPSPPWRRAVRCRGCGCWPWP